MTAAARRLCRLGTKPAFACDISDMSFLAKEIGMLPQTILVDEVPRCVVRPTDKKDLDRFIRNSQQPWREARFRESSGDRMRHRTSPAPRLPHHGISRCKGLQSLDTG